VLIKNVVGAPLKKFVNQPAQRGSKSSSMGGILYKGELDLLGSRKYFYPFEVGDTYSLNGFTTVVAFD